ncbi:MAG: molybdate ABC transporter substrate-binding protein [Sulfuricella denitrificans]|nr:molybdate ABC transporter substrate-binding protein [Sulfuricella denitrificans]
MRPMKFTVFVLIWMCAFSAAADTVQVAVASNFATPMARIAAEFQRDTGHQLLISSGSSGKFYAQIASGAPFEVFLSADDEIPLRLEKEGLAVTGSRVTYAIGKLVLWSPRPGYVDGKGEIMRSGSFARLSIANPKTAPYGAAAREAMERQSVWQMLQPRLVQGESIAQAYQFVASGNAELGFVALSQVRNENGEVRGSMWLVPQALFTPIRQDGALLLKGKGKAAAGQFLAYLRSPKATAIIQSFGYELP